MRMTVFILIVNFLSGCAFNFDVTSQRTALENQVMGTYKELDDELVLSAAVRGDQANTKPGNQALKARHNQMFNIDEIQELKNAGLLGEGSDGFLKRISKKNAQIDIPNSLVENIDPLNRQENADREVIWRHIINENKNLTSKDLPNIARSYAKIMQEKSVPGQWYQDDSGNWLQKK